MGGANPGNRTDAPANLRSWQGRKCVQNGPAFNIPLATAYRKWLSSLSHYPGSAGLAGTLPELPSSRWPVLSMVFPATRPSALTARPPWPLKSPNPQLNPQMFIKGTHLTISFFLVCKIYNMNKLILCKCDFWMVCYFRIMLHRPLWRNILGLCFEQFTHLISHFQSLFC